MKKAIIILLVFLLSLTGYSKKIFIKNDHSNSDLNITKVKEDTENSYSENTKDTTTATEVEAQVSSIVSTQLSSNTSSTDDETSTNQGDDYPVDSKPSNLAIEKITIEYHMNSKRKFEQEYPLNVKDDNERTIFYGNTLFANIKFSEDISEYNIENKLKTANPDVYIYAWLIEKNLLSIGLCFPDDSNPKDIDFIIPKRISSISGFTLDEDRVLKLKSIPEVTVNVISHNEAFPLINEEPFNLYYSQIERNMAYEFSLIFNSNVDKESVINTVKSVFSKYNTDYSWLSDRELKISFKNVKDNIDGKIDFSSALDENGNKIYKTLFIAIDTTKASTYDLNDVFPNTEGVSWHYMNSDKYYFNEKIVSIKYERDKKVIMVDGKIEFHPAYKDEIPNYNKKYTISEDSIELFYNDMTIPLLKSPIEPGTSWSHNWYDNIKAETTITDVIDNKIVTRTKILDPSYHIKSIKTIYKMDTGIQEIYYYPDDEDFPDNAIVLKNIS